MLKRKWLLSELFSTFFDLKIKLKIYFPFKDASLRIFEWTNYTDLWNTTKRRRIGKVRTRLRDRERWKITFVPRVVFACLETIRLILSLLTPILKVNMAFTGSYIHLLLLLSLNSRVWVILPSLSKALKSSGSFA